MPRLSPKIICTLKPLPHFPDPLLLATALTHKSVDATPGKNYERFEFLGDSFFGLLVTVYLFNMYRNMNTNVLRGFLVSNKDLIEWAHIHNLSSLLVSKNMFNKDHKVHADILESYFGVAAYYSFVEHNSNAHFLKELSDWFTDTLKTKLSPNSNNQKFNYYSINPINICGNKKQLVTKKFVRKISVTSASTDAGFQTVGKSVIHFIITLLLVQNNPKFNEGQLSKARENIYLSQKYKNIGLVLPCHLSKGLKLANKQSDSIKKFEICIGNYVMESYSCTKFSKKILNIKDWFSTVLFKKETTFIPKKQIIAQKRKLTNDQLNKLFRGLINTQKVQFVEKKSRCQQGKTIHHVSIIMNTTGIKYAAFESSCLEDANRNGIIKALRNPMIKGCCDMKKWHELTKEFGKNKEKGISFPI